MNHEIQLHAPIKSPLHHHSPDYGEVVGGAAVPSGDPRATMGAATSDSDPSLEAILPSSSKEQQQQQQKQKSSKRDKLTLIPLIFLIYFEVSGGPYGSEPAVGAAGPLLALLGFLIFPFIWSIPEALLTAELSTTLPGNGGFVLWSDAAFGPLAGTLMGTWKFLSGVINNAAYPVLCADYLGRAIPSLRSSGGPRDAATVGFTVALSFLNYTGLTIVGYTAMLLGVISLLPFLIMSLISLPKIKPSRWGIMNLRDVDWRLYLNTLFWNLNFWDNASTMAGEVERPQKTFPKALLAAVLMTCVSYLMPLLAGTGALAVGKDQWGDGFYADAAGMIAGKWLKYWIEVGAVLSAIGLYEAQLSSCAYQLLGMADLGILPRFVGTRSKWFNTPWFGILVSSAITLAISFMSFTDIISSANFLYSLGMLLEFASFLWLRKKQPDLKRPYRVPVKLPALICMCLVPTAFLIYVMVIATWKVWVISIGLTIYGIAMHFVITFCKSKGYLQFSKGEEILQEIEDDNYRRDQA